MRAISNMSCVNYETDTNYDDDLLLQLVIYVFYISEIPLVDILLNILINK